MPINVYTGLMGSGKSYEVVRMVILPAILKGRRVVTNVDGIDGEEIRAFLHEKEGGDFNLMGNVIHVTNDEVRSANFLPHGTDTATIVLPGDLVCVDEAWRFWGGDSKSIPPEHFIFFREHRHYVDPVSKVSCDLVLMVQDILDLTRRLKVVVELTFRTEKKKALGLTNTYSVSMHEGYKINGKTRIGNWVRKYDKQIFPLYSSYAGGAGKEISVDSRHNILKSGRFLFVVIASIVVGTISIRFIWSFFHPRTSSNTKMVESGAGAKNSSSKDLIENGTAPQVSDVWRIAGRIDINGFPRVVLISSSGQARVVAPNGIEFDGLRTSGLVDGKMITSYSGVGSSSSFLSLPQAPLIEAKK